MFLAVTASYTHSSLRSSKTLTSTSGASAPAEDYALTVARAELSLAESDQPYLVVDLRTNRLLIKLHGAIARDISMSIRSDSPQVRRFIGQFTESASGWRPISRVHLFEGRPLVNETVLTVVSEATNAEPEQLQRYLPKQMAIT
ncbi:MAG: hypothetical protein AB1744_16140, partial [Candidatus Zixiibacteriota bacterium]